MRPGATAGIDTEPAPRSHEAADVPGEVRVDGVLEVVVVPLGQPVVCGISQNRAIRDMVCSTLRRIPARA